MAVLSFCGERTHVGHVLQDGGNPQRAVLQGADATASDTAGLSAVFHSAPVFHYLNVCALTDVLRRVRILLVLHVLAHSPHLSSHSSEIMQCVLVVRFRLASTTNQQTFNTSVASGLTAGKSLLQFCIFEHVVSQWFTFLYFDELLKITRQFKRFLTFRLSEILPFFQTLYSYNDFRSYFPTLGPELFFY